MIKSKIMHSLIRHEIIIIRDINVVLVWNRLVPCRIVLPILKVCVTLFAFYVYSVSACLDVNPFLSKVLSTPTANDVEHLVRSNNVNGKSNDCKHHLTVYAIILVIRIKIRTMICWHYHRTVTPKCAASFQGITSLLCKLFSHKKNRKKRKIRLPINRLITMEEELRREQLKVKIVTLTWN